jgi:CRP-like cAMP-binding protein
MIFFHCPLDHGIYLKNWFGTGKFDQVLSEAQMKLLAANLEEKVVPRSEFLFRDQEVVNCIMILVQGKVRIQKEDSSEGQRILCQKAKTNMFRLSDFLESRQDFLRAGACFGTRVNCPECTMGQGMLIEELVSNSLIP